MSIQQQPQGFSGPPSSMEARPGESALGDTTGARPLKASGAKRVPLGASAGGGLIVGLVAGFILIGGGDSKKAEASKEPVVTAKAEAAPKTLGELAESDAPSAPTAEANAPAPSDGEVPGAGSAGDGQDSAATKAEAAVAPAAKPEPSEVVKPTPPTPEPEPEPEPMNVAVQFDVTGLEDGVEASITVNGSPVNGTSAPLVIPAGKQSLKAKVLVKAKGYRNFRKTLTVTEDVSIPVVMRKKPAGGPRKKPGGPGGLLDL